MLTTETKKYIDSARDVLVGKVPNPISQIQEITNALIYKFMDDMDDHAIKAGGKRKYFSGEYEKYSWQKILDPKIGAYERIGLYTEALNKLSNNPHLPELFRNIFRNAYLPYNDGRVLTLFLNEINHFNYKHTEELGDAYEYLLSIMGSQGDAGSFRTPRHIIDFIVKTIDPDKDDMILDPACGTAGFLISAYKRILSKYDGKDDVTGEAVSGEKRLSADEKKKLHNNIRGFDISDEMVKMAQVNLYLHGFPEPNIIVHDTLSSEDYWQDKYSVIMANPPFMSPKGGIQPHSKFGVKSNRSEVLFVDYIMNHLKPNGRAGVIVPEGIIFQSGKAYVELRKHLVEDGLYAVVSLPSGVFNPYAGVKTSILFFNNELAKQSDEILFLKIENDGYDLGAQRRQIDKNDLPLALEILSKWKFGEKAENKLAQYIEKSKITESDDYNLSGDRYRVTTDYSNTKWPMVSIGEVAEYINGFPFKPTDWGKTGTPIIRIQNLTGSSESIHFTDKNDVPDKIVVNNSDLLISWSATIGFYIWQGSRAYLNQHIFKVIPSEKINKMYLFFLGGIISDEIRQKTHGNTMTHITKGTFSKIKIPLPPIEIQEQIVAELDGYQKIIDGAKQIVNNWKPKIDIDPEWEKVRIGVVSGINEKTITINENTDYKYIDISSVENETGRITIENTILGKNLPSRARRQVAVGDVLLSTVRPNLKAFTYIKELPENAVTSTGFAVISPKEKVISLWIYYLSLSDYLQEQMVAQMGKGAYPSINQNDVRNLEIPLPPLDIQKQIVEKIEAECALVESSKKLIEIYEQKSKEVIAKLWN